MNRIPTRIVKVRIGPAGSSGLEWSDIYVEAEIEKTVGSVPNKATVSLYNLSLGSLQWIEQPGMTVQALAGTDVASQLFVGDIPRKGIKTSIQLPDQITTIEAADGQAVYRDAYFIRSYPPGTARSVIMTDVAGAGGLSIGYIDPTIQDRIYASGITFAAKLRDVLSELWAPEGALWSIQDRTITVLALGRAGPGNAAVISPRTGLIGSPERTDNGISLTTILSPQIGPGGLVSVQSRMVTGSYKVSKITHSVDSWGLKWDSKLVCVPI